MCKLLNMRYLYFLFILTTVTLFNCDGRARAHKKNVQVLNENKLLESFSKKIEYTPKQYTEIVTDTILSNHFRIKLKYYSLSNDIMIKHQKLHNEWSYTHHFTNFEAKLNIQFSNSSEINLSINKESFTNFNNEAFWSEAIMQYPWVDYEATTKNTVSINVSFCKPESRSCLDYRLTFTDKGDYTIKRINLLKTTT